VRNRVLRPVDKPVIGINPAAVGSLPPPGDAGIGSVIRTPVEQFKALRHDRVMLGIGQVVEGVMVQHHRRQVAVDLVRGKVRRIDDRKQRLLSGIVGHRGDNILHRHAMHLRRHDFGLRAAAVPDADLIDPALEVRMQVRRRDPPRGGLHPAIGIAVGRANDDRGRNAKRRIGVDDAGGRDQAGALAGGHLAIDI